MADGINRRFDFAAPLPLLQDVRAVHLIAIGGSGMSGIAALFLARGVTVTGSDRAENDAVQRLRAAGVPVVIGQNADNVTGLDAGTLVVVSSAIGESNPELAAARERGLRVLHRSQALAVLTQGRRAIAVGGANGKTTTSAMAVVALRSAGAGPSFAIGSDIAGIGANSGVGDGESFVVEADESDGSFVVYRPQIAVVTNVRDDHLDFYGTSERLHAAYDDFAASTRPGGLLVACADDEGSAALARRHAARLRVLTYGRSPDADLRLSDESADGMSASALLSFPSGERVAMRLQVPGAHNLLNAAAVALALTAGCGIAPEAAVRGLADFHGTSRRFEVRGSAAGVRVVDDYAHNPDKLQAAIRTGLALRDGGRLIVLFQPHLYSRTQAFAEQFAAALRLADAAFVMDVYAAREEPVPGVTGRLLSDRVPGAVFVASGADAVDAVADAARDGDLVLTIGAGDVTALASPILQRLAERSTSS
ncbi:UDP-N-acetylmuramate--L-alanine ligase [Allobranchiibius sp. GilTou73]|uniref:UDP-N-acetylmuramate--L-alanine ligase n=1 Tax=Allobranchiibius sp. GilTou73 TaxID=2904523 RepID=UPI001F42EAA8|nr:UDP-N-acetylmuramate--L-alanine ligase [Allobranchiibius sp. GilTou73]UIJ33541.1 UDP-N-acetylmuramate--L-alanine ligase [Allobranchiibius sp. GilTou73]